MSFKGDWIFNTDESEEPGQNAYSQMFAQSRVAAWGSDYDAERMLAKPCAGHRVFFYRDEVGIIGMATFTDESPFSSNLIFGKQMEGEFHRRVINLKVVPNEKAMAWSSIVELTKYHLPVHGDALHRLHNSSAAKIIAKRLEKL
jgi:hypothetical protein